MSAHLSIKTNSTVLFPNAFLGFKKQEQKKRNKEVIARSNLGDTKYNYHI